MQFHKVLAKYYRKWAIDCLESAEYCDANGWSEDAEKYRRDAAGYEQLLEDYKEAIEFFSTGDNAYLLDGALPAKWRGYK